MLLELARWLQSLENFFGLFGYLTFRGILAALTALFLSLWWGPAVIRRLAQFKGGQPIRQDGPQTHFSKAGTPTMGGGLILMTVLAAVLLWGDLRNKYVWVVVLVMLAFGAIRNTRLPVSLNEATWIITDSVSITKMPPMITSTSSWRTITALVPSTAPSASAPMSPMNTIAGEVLNQRKPRPAAAMAAQMITSSPAPGTCGLCR